MRGDAAETTTQPPPPAASGMRRGAAASGDAEEARGRYEGNDTLLGPIGLRGSNQDAPARTTCRAKCRPCRTSVTVVDVCVASVFVVTMFLGLLSSAAATTMGDSCDWFGSGLSGPERGVSPVYLRCAQGHLEWSYPRGALRVLLRMGGAGADFRGCVRLGERAQGARLFLEGPRSLSPLFDDADGAPRRLARCFRSRGGQAALYVESVPAPPGDFSKRVLSFTYDLEPLPRGAKGYDPAEQCRPCTKEEMSLAFCTSDLVARGIIRGVQNKPELEVTELDVKVTKLLRRSTDAAGGLCGENEVSPWGDCYGDAAADADPAATATTPAAPTSVPLQVPVHCGARHGSGEFVFMARRKLGDLALTCAPRLEDWVAAVRDLEATGAAHCVLAS